MSNVAEETTISPETNKKKTVSLKEFAEENHRLITVIGVMGGLAALFTRLGNPEADSTFNFIVSLLSFLAFGMMILLAWELWRSFPKSEEASLTMAIFEWFGLIFVFALGGYLLVSYPMIIRTFVLPQVVGTIILAIFSGAFALLSRKLKTYAFVRRVAPEGKKYSSIKRGIIAIAIILPFFVLSIVLAQYLFNSISSVYG